MADNLDALLEEAEEKFCRNPGLSGQPEGGFTGKQDGFRLRRNNESVRRATNQPETCDDDIDAVLQEILDDEYPADGSDIPPAVKNYTKDYCPQTSTKKCCPVFLGGTLVTSGVGTNISQRACDQLRCTSCDFCVAMFDDHEWDYSCNYLFFRNNMPDRTKLRAKLKRRQGARAYACQCSWHSAVSLSELRHIPQLKWVCGQHRPR